MSGLRATRRTVNSIVDSEAGLMHSRHVTSQELKRWLAKQGCRFGTQVGSHLKVFRDGKTSILPIHGSSHELGTALVNKIKKDLGLK